MTDNETNSTTNRFEEESDDVITKKLEIYPGKEAQGTRKRIVKIQRKPQPRRQSRSLRDKVWSI